MPEYGRRQVAQPPRDASGAAKQIQVDPELARQREQLEREQLERDARGAVNGPGDWLRWGQRQERDLVEWLDSLGGTLPGPAIDPYDAPRPESRLWFNPLEIQGGVPTPGSRPGIGSLLHEGGAILVEYAPTGYRLLDSLGYTVVTPRQTSTLDTPPTPVPIEERYGTLPEGRPVGIAEQPSDGSTGQPPALPGAGVGQQQIWRRDPVTTSPPAPEPLGWYDLFSLDELLQEDAGRG